MDSRAENSPEKAIERWWLLLFAVLTATLSGFFTLITNVVPATAPFLALVLVIAEFLLLCIMIAALAYLASSRETKERIRNMLATQRMIVTTVVAGVVVVGVVTVTLYWWRRIVPVPDLIGKNLAQATMELTKAGLQPQKYIAPGADDFSPITHQEPSPNVQIMRDSSVHFVVGVLSATITINDPEDKGSAIHTTIVRGTSEGILESRGRLRANLLLKSLNADGYWIYGPLTVDAAGNWQHTVYVGQPSEVGKQFQLIAIVTQERLKAQGSEGGSPEYLEVPPHIATSELVTMTRE